MWQKIWLKITNIDCKLATDPDLSTISIFKKNYFLAFFTFFLFHFQTCNASFVFSYMCNIFLNYVILFNKPLSFLVL